MIKCDMGKLEIIGEQAIIMAETTLILSKISELMAQEILKCLE